jgi:hypothetical protein
MSQFPDSRPDWGRSVAECWLNVIAGIWLIVSPVILGFVGSVPNASWNTFIAGGLIVMFACGRAAQPAANMALSWLNFLVGVWLMVSPFVLQYSAIARPLCNDVLVGLLVAIVSLTNTQTMPRARQPLQR